MDIKKTLILTIFLLCIGLVVSAPPVTTVQNFPEGYMIVESPHQYLKQNQDYQYNFFVYNSSDGLVSNNNSMTCNFFLANSSGEVIYTNNAIYFPDGHWGIDISGGNFSLNGEYPYGVSCQDGRGGSLAGIFEVTPTGKSIEDIGGISSTIIVFFAILGIGFIFLGLVLMKNKSLWITYSGLFMMILGFAFLYYDLHLTNLYAQTIAFNSGAGTVTSGAFVMITRFIKLAPYIVAGIIAFSAVKMFQGARGKRNMNDGWDNNAY